MTEKQCLKVLKAREANLSQPSLGAVINPDGTVESVGQMQSSEQVQEQTQRQSDALQQEAASAAAQLQVNPNTEMSLPTFDPLYDF
jgi:hypothetical protein